MARGTAGFPAIVFGHRFSTFAKFKSAMAEWSANGNFDIRYEYSGKIWNIAVCWVAECAIRSRAILKPKLGYVEIPVLNGEHTACVGLMHSNHRSISIHQFLLEAVPRAMKIGAAARPRGVAKAIYYVGRNP